jgi:hypothetical protein
VRVVTPAMVEMTAGKKRNREVQEEAVDVLILRISYPKSQDITRTVVPHGSSAAVRISVRVSDMEFLQLCQ